MSEFLTEAGAIGDRLASKAFLHRGRINWLTRTIPYKSGGHEAKDTFPELMALNPSVYSGTAGNALFLARLSKFTDSRVHRETALGAMRHAVAHAHYRNDTPVGAIGAQWRFGFYLGTLGIAWAAHEVGITLGEPTLERDSKRILRDLEPTVAKPKDQDAMFGPAGAIPALLDLGRQGVEGATDMAERLGRELVATARPKDDGAGLSWGSAYNATRPNLTGLSHGTSGFALALSELYAATKDSAFLECARQAIEYERSFFNPEEGNWPNFQATPDSHGHYPCATSWCHGAPGIGLARTAITPVWSDAAMRSELATAATTTRDFLAKEMEFPGKDYMLCHGLAGNLECLWAMEESRGNNGFTSQIRDVASRAIEAYGAGATKRWGPTIEWPLGVTNGTYPTLVTGVAGIGYWLLRMHAGASLPTVLLPARSWRNK